MIINVYALCKLMFSYIVDVIISNSFKEKDQSQRLVFFKSNYIWYIQVYRCQN